LVDPSLQLASLSCPKPSQPRGRLSSFPPQMDQPLPQQTFSLYLPPELVSHIFSFCPPSSLASITRSSFTFLELASPFLYKSVRLEGREQLQRLFGGFEDGLEDSEGSVESENPAAVSQFDGRKIEGRKEGRARELTSFHLLSRFLLLRTQPRLTSIASLPTYPSPKSNISPSSPSASTTSSLLSPDVVSPPSFPCSSSRPSPYPSLPSRTSRSYVQLRTPSSSSSLLEPSTSSAVSPRNDPQGRSLSRDSPTSTSPNSLGLVSVQSSSSTP